MKRIYGSLLLEHIAENRQMALLTGPRQVGKTYTSRNLENPYTYLTWDNVTDKKIVMSGPDTLAARLGLSNLQSNSVLLILDEIHKYSKWKSFLKGFYDTYGQKCRTIVTGSARMNIYKRGGDSLMGRYFLYRMHPLSLRELSISEIGKNEINPPVKIDKESCLQLLEFGGFPEPFLKANKRFYNRWKRLRTEQLFYEDIRDLTKINEISQIELLAELIKEQSGRLVNFSTLASTIQVSVESIQRWISILESMYYCFLLRPWSINVPKSIRKQPKIYLWDWSLITDKGFRYENFVAAHLLKAVHFWTDLGYASYGLHFLRDKEKREVDFLVTRDKKPFFLVEVKSSATNQISPTLEYFQQQTGSKHAFQIAFDLDFVDRDCFQEKTPIQVPAATLLTQLI